MLLRLWVSLAALSVIVGLGVILVVWLVRSELRERRRRRAVRRFLDQYRKEPSTLPVRESLVQKVTVDELIGRTKAEGLAVRLGWEEDEHGCGQDEDDWPTGVLPRSVDDVS